MVEVNENAISLTRGDTLRVKVDIKYDGQDYQPKENEVVRFALKHAAMNVSKTEYTDNKPLVKKVIPNDTLVLELEPSDTASLGFGRYAYDIQITFEDGAIDTFISDYLILTKEVD